MKMAQVSGTDSAGTSRLVWWLLGVITAIALSLTGAWAKWATSQIHDNDHRITTQVEQITDIKETVHRIEDKMDKQEAR